jgi:predicted TIM-barrel fold metal-dependent hydrolase
MATRTDKLEVVDADAHVNPSPDFWADYLPDSLKSLAPRIVPGGADEDCDYVEFEGRRKKLNLIGAQAGRTGMTFKMEGKLADSRSGGWMPAARLEDMDQDGIDSAVLYGGGPLGTANNELFQASFHAYNHWLADFCDYAPTRFAGIGYVPMQNVDESIAMMRDCVKRGLKGINIPAFPMAKDSVAKGGAGAAQVLALTGDTSGARNYSDAEFDPFWKTACDLGIPITIHLGGRGVRFQEPKHFLPDLLMSKFAMAEPIAVLVFGSVFQRFPDLRFVTVESGVGWFAFAANYMDETWKKQRYWTKSDLEEMPSFYMSRNVFGSFIHDRPGVEMRNFPGAGNIMWSSDYPHSETTFPHSQEVIEQLFMGIPGEDKALIIGRRAKQLFNM